MKKELLRKLPKVDAFMENEQVVPLLDKHTRVVVVEALREAIEGLREEILESKLLDFDTEEVIKRLNKVLQQKEAYRLKRVVNAAGIVIHTNLGRSLLSTKAAERVQQIISGYSNLEYDLEKGTRGSRYASVEELITAITGAEAAVVVNNNAAAVMLILSSLAKGGECVVSRGELIEIGGKFRIPDVMEQSGATLVEVGTTNKTHYSDYEDAITEETKALLKVHTSNYRIVGFTESVTIDELVPLAKEIIK